MQNPARATIRWTRRQAVEAPGHPHAEAVMILDHKRAFDYV
jgi:hypothetical protein